MKKLLVGLGNPGKKYENTTHNVGFLFLDYLASDMGVSWVVNKKFNSLLAETSSFYLVKPQGFMNLSGTPVKKLVDYYDIPQERLIVIHDDIDLPFKTFKIQQARGAAGHNGVKDIITHLGSNNFWRVRIGVGRPENTKIEVKDFVLSPVSESISDIFPQISTQLVF